MDRIPIRYQKPTKEDGVNLFRYVSGMMVFCVLMAAGCGDSEQVKMTKELQAFIATYENTVVPLSKEAGIAYFNASLSGKEEDYNKAGELQVELKKIYSNPDDFALLKRIKESGKISDSLLIRELDLLYNAYLGNQISIEKLEKLVNQQTEIEKKFNTFRASVKGESKTDNEIEEILKKSGKTAEVEAAWKASKEIGPLVAEDIKALVKLRNEVAVELGFANYHQMQLKLSEQDPEEIKVLFDQLDELTREAFTQVKHEIDSVLSKRYGIGTDKLMPWHYQNRFFQEAPAIYEVDLDQYYADKDLVKLTQDYYAGIGLPVDDVIANSDLFEKPGKYQHAYCTDIDKLGDVRVVCNIKPNNSWMNTMLHEFGHAVYSKFNDRALPWTLRDAAHIFTTEAIAMMFGRFASNPVWMKDMVGISAEEAETIRDASFRSLRLEQLVFSRWAQVMYRFEKSMYENPDQDLNALWWDLVEQYQGLKRPEGRNQPDWASKIHIATVPAYYHNYLMGELLASQLYHHIAANVLGVEDIYGQSFAGQTKVGQYLQQAVFAPGMKYGWNEMIEKATGEKLTPVYYAKQFVQVN